jgi:hypothetical protein
LQSGKYGKKNLNRQVDKWGLGKNQLLENNKITGITTSLSRITMNVNGHNSPIIRFRRWVGLKNETKPFVAYMKHT